MKLRAPIFAIVALVFVSSALQTGCGRMKKMGGIGKATVDLSDGKIDASLTLTKYNTTQGLSIGVPKLENAVINFGPADGGKGVVLEFVSPIQSILDAIASEQMPEQGLPDGRPLYGITTGQLPAFDLQVEKLKLRLYLSDETFGIFVPLNLPDFGADPIQFPIKDRRGYVVAYGFGVPPKGGRGSGLLLLFPLPTLASLRST
jgi:hypothetical protein